MLGLRRMMLTGLVAMMPAMAMGADAATATPEFLSGQHIVSELTRLGRFEKATPTYGSGMGRAYRQAMDVVTQGEHYTKPDLRGGRLDPTTEAHESLHGMSSLIRQACGRDIDSGYDVIYVGRGRFAEISLGPRITKRSLAKWAPERARRGFVGRLHLADPDFVDSHVALVIEELAYHLLDARIALEDHAYLQNRLRLSAAATAPVAEWAVLGLATAAMLDATPGAYPSDEDRARFERLVRYLVEEAVDCYARGMDIATYGRLANLTSDVRDGFTYVMTEPSRQARALRRYCERTYGADWLPGLVARVEEARRASESDAYPGPEDRVDLDDLADLPVSRELPGPGVVEPRARSEPADPWLARRRSAAADPYFTNARRWGR